MTLADTLQQRLSEWRPAGTGRQRFAHHDAATGTAVRLDVDHLETLSCQLWEAAVTRSAEAMAAEPSLEGWARRVADSVTGLLEPLKLVEVDKSRGQALLRSDEPAQKAGDRFYYEVLLERTGHASVRRFKGSTTAAKREQVAFALTREAVGKLVEDLAANG